MNKVLLSFLSSIALIGVLNCAAVEPAFACHEDAAHSESSEEHCECFMHCSMHHQWLSSDVSGLFYPADAAGAFVPFAGSGHHASTPPAIFHPPLAI